MSVYGKLTVEISDDNRYEKGKTYDLVLNTSVTPDPSQVVVATIPAEVTASSAVEQTPVP